MKKPNTERYPISTYLKKSKFTIHILFLLLMSFVSKADVITYEWAENYKGYTLKQIPGSSEFLAGGTYYQNQNNVPILFQLGVGYHLLHLDASGNVIQDIKYTPDNTINPNYTELRVVDIVPLNNKTECWVIMQAEESDPNTAIVRHYIYAEKVDLATGAKSINLPYDFKISVGQVSLHQNVYATSAVQVNDILFISGYKSDNTITGPNPQGPTPSSLNKVGCLFKAWVNGTTMSFSRYDYNTPDYGVNDYDMALRVKVMPTTWSNPTQPSLILVGAANNGYGHQSAGSLNDVHGSGVFLARFDPNASPITSMGLMAEVVVYDGQSGTTPHGLFGVDATDDGSNVYVTCNRSGNNQQERWGILRVQSSYTNSNDLRPTTGLPYYLTHSTSYLGDDWSRQLFHKVGLHAANNDYILGGYAIDFPNRDISCDQYGATYPPSVDNVLPFMADMTINYTGGVGITGTINSYTLQNNDRGTKSADPNQSMGFYYPHGSAGWNMNEDIVRLHSPFAEDLWPTINYDYKIMAPMTGYHPNAPVLNAKFIEVNVYGSETTCGKELNGCTMNLVPSELNYYDNSQAWVIRATGFAYLTSGTYAMTQVIDAPITNDCNTNTSYKPSGVTTIQEQSEISIFPNPATTELNVKLGGVATNTNFEFVLTDVTGKVLLSTKGINNGAVQHIQLPNLSTGIYVATIETNGQKHTEKIVIE